MSIEVGIEPELAALRRSAPRTVLPAVELGTGMADGFAVFDSPVGEVAVTFNISGVSSVGIADGDLEVRFADRFDRLLHPADPPRGWGKKIERAIDRGTPGDLPLDLRSVTPFQQSVLEAAAGIPRGEVRPYRWLAREVGRPKSARAVGSTMARNPVPLIVPCHRVVRADGRVGAYSLGGPHNKWHLLEHEGADPDLLEDLARRSVRFVGSDTTHIFCHPTCRNARRITDRHLVEFAGADEAAEAGYRACEVCRP